MQISDFSIVLTTGISERAIGRIRTEYKEKGVFGTPKKRYARPRHRIDPDDFDRDAICRLIHYHYKNRKNLTLKKILVRDGTLLCPILLNDQYSYLPKRLVFSLERKRP